VIFSTQVFLFLFLPPVLLIGLFLKKEAQNLFLLLASLFFYAWGEGELVLLLLASALLNHWFGRAIGAGGTGRRRKAVLLLAIVLNLGLLAACKYAAFLAGILEPLRRAVGLPGWQGLALPMPLGISFFTFMAIAYLVEVHDGAIPAERSFLRTALFISFFPTVLAGPINRYSKLRQQLAERRTTAEQLASGIRRFIAGLGKKVLLADALARVVDPIFALPGSNLNAGLAWLGAAGYTLQIYLDFSGYSDMAIGLGRMFGFTFMENFNFPYLARSIKGFWDRWHISLSSWLRDFLFLRLAFAISRRMRGERWLGIAADSWCYYPAMLATMTLCGLWHGAAWTFVAWGLYHGLFIMLERFAFARRLRRLWPPLQVAYCLLVVAFGWVLFRANGFSQAVAHWRAMLGLGRGRAGGTPLSHLDAKALFVLLASLLAAFAVLPALRRRWQAVQARARRSAASWLQTGGLLAADAFLLLVLLASAMELAMVHYRPFIYFRF
jgi:alginate O-acetyltransferase complex protein AlgI